MHFFGTIGVLLMSIGSLINIYLAGIRIFYNAGIGNRPSTISRNLVNGFGCTIFIHWFFR